MNNPQKIAEIRKLARMIRGIKTAMLTTVDAEGRIHSRPMATEQVEFDGNLWFFTRIDSGKIGEIRRDARANVAYADNGKSRYISVSGSVEIVRDPVKARELWRPDHREWFPRGLADADLVLLKVRAEQAEYWDRSDAKTYSLFHLVRSLISGKPREQQGSSQKIDLAA